MGKDNVLCTADGNVNLDIHYGTQCEDFQKVKLELPYDPAIQLLGITPLKC